jgi:hypothetical protein
MKRWSTSWSIGRPSITNVVVTVALVMVCSAGTAVAALTVRSIDIVDGEVKTVDLANGAVTNAKIAANAVTGAKVDESTLAIVPNANLLDGRDSTSFATGPGRMFSDESTFSWGDGVYMFLYGTGLDIGFNVLGHCYDNKFYFTSYGASWDVWIRADGTDPAFGQVGAYPNDTFATTVPNSPPHVVTFHAVQPSTGRQAFVEMTVRGIPPPGSDGFGNCYTYATVVLNY